MGRIVIAFLVGMLLGVAGVTYLLASGAGDFVISGTGVVKDMKRELEEVKQQRDGLRRELDDVVARASRMEGSFGELERRFRDLQQQLDGQRGDRRPPAEEPAR